MEMLQIHECAHQFDYIREMSCMKKKYVHDFVFLQIHSVVIIV